MNGSEYRAAEFQRILKNLVQVYTCHGFRGDAARLKLAMLTAYFDESGLAPSDKFCTVAGFVGDEGQWSAFANDWIKALGNHRTNLHLTKLRWNKRYEKIVADLARLGPIPHKYNLSPVRVGLWHRDSEELVKGKINETFTNPYVMCSMTAISAVLQEVIGPNDEVMFIFDMQQGRRAKVMNIMNEIVFKWAKLDRRVKDIDFRSHKTTVCLDPGDYLAFAFREYQVNKTSKKTIACAPIADCAKMYGGILGRHQIEELARGFIEEGMVPGSNWRKISPSLLQFLSTVGWSEADVDKFKKHVDDKNKKGNWGERAI